MDSIVLNVKRIVMIYDKVELCLRESRLLVDFGRD